MMFDAPDRIEAERLDHIGESHILIVDLPVRFLRAEIILKKERCSDLH